MSTPPLEHCPKGHPLTPENTYLRKSGARECRTCRNESKRRYRQTEAGKETGRRNLLAWAKRQEVSE